MSTVPPSTTRKSPLLTLDEALSAAARRGRARCRRLRRAVSTFDALGRVLAADVRSTLDVPPADNTSMDGYALRCADVPAAGHGAAGQPAHPGRRGRRAARSRARRRASSPARRCPPGADAVVMQEQCERARRRRCASTPCRQPGQWIRRRGEDVRRGARRAARRHAADAAGARPGGVGRRRPTLQRGARGRGSRCSRPATSWRCPASR